MTTVIGDAFVRVRPITSQFASDAQGGLSGLKSMLGSLGVPSSLLSGFALTSAGIAGAAAAAVTLGVKMQSADAAIAASSGISMKAATDLGNAMLATGGKSEFSGQQMATAYAGVAGQLKFMNGGALSTAQSLTFLKATTDLATASGQDLGTTTSTLAGVLQAFQLKVSDTAQVSNVLFNASNATGQSFTTLATALERTRSKLGDTSPSLAALTTLMVDMTKNGITGRAALSGLNTSMTALMGAATGTTKANLTAKQTLADYGIAAEGADGKIVSMATVIDTLGPKYATMTQAQQLSTSSLIFGASAAKQMTAVINGGIGTYNASATAVNKANAVQDAAAVKAHTMSVEFQIVKVDLEDMATKAGEVLVPALTLVTGAILPLVTDFLNFASWLEKGSSGAKILGIAIGVALTPVLVSMGAKAVVSFGEMMSSMTETIALEALYAKDTAINAASAAASWLTGGTAIEGTDAAIVTANEEAGASFTAMLGPIALVAAAGAAAFIVTTKLLDKLGQLATVNPSAKAGAGLTNQQQIVEAWDKAHGVNTKGLFTSSTALSSSVFKTADAWYKAQQAQQSKATDAWNNPLGVPGVGKGKGNAAAPGKDAYIPPATAATAAAKAASDKLSAAELALQVTGTAALNTMVTAAHSKSLAILNTALNATHLAATKSLVTRLDDTHNKVLTALATKLEADQHNEEVARTAIITSDTKTANSALNSQLSLVTSTSLATLNTGLNATHNKALVTLENQLTATHNKNLVSLASQLVAVHKQAMDNLVAQTLAANAAAAAKAAGGVAAVTAAQETVNEDLLNSKFVNAGTPDAAVAAAQLALDQQKLADAQQSSNLQNQLAAATTTAAQTAAQTAIDNATAQSTINEASLAASLSWATTMQTISNNATSAAAALAPAAPAIAAAVAPLIAVAADTNTIGALNPVPSSPVTSYTTVTINASTSSTADQIAAQIQTVVAQNNENIVNLMAARGK